MQRSILFAYVYVLLEHSDVALHISEDEWSSIIIHVSEP